MHQQADRTVHETAFAKINLDLRVCRRREDGYHDLDSLVVFAGIGDRLTFEAADALTLSVRGPFAADLGHEADNLVLRAAAALADFAGRAAHVRITLEKSLPVASGLGGGSADAAATLRGLIALWDLPVNLGDLVPLARTLGADVPVCLGSTSARMQAIGDQLTPIMLPADLPMVLVNPGEAVSTAGVFRWLQHLSGRRDPTRLDQTLVGFTAQLANSVNDLEIPAIETTPVIGSVIDALRHQGGCRLARMSGSGATCFALFDNDTMRDRAVSELVLSHPDWWVVGTRTR